MYKKTYQFFNIMVCVSSSHEEVHEYIRQYISSEPERSSNIIKKVFNVNCFLSTSRLGDEIEKFKLLNGTIIQIHKNDMFVVHYQLNDSDVYVCTKNNYIIYMHGSKLDIFTTSEVENASSMVLRAIRELIFRNAENSGALVLHAAAGCIENHGILICGHKGSGKSTMLLHLLHLNGKFMSNDRVIVAQRHNDSYIDYVPLSVPISLGTIMQPHLNLYNQVDLSQLKRKQKDIFLSNSLLSLYKEQPEIKIDFTPEEVVKYFQVGSCAHSKLKCVIFPNFVKDYTGLKFQPIDNLSMQQQLVEVCCTPYDENWLNPWLTKYEKSETELQNDSEKILIPNISSGVFGIRITFGDNQLHQLTKEKFLSIIKRKEDNFDFSGEYFEDI